MNRIKRFAVGNVKTAKETITLLRVQNQVVPNAISLKEQMKIKPVCNL